VIGGTMKNEYCSQEIAAKKLKTSYRGGGSKERRGNCLSIIFVYNVVLLTALLG